MKLSKIDLVICSCVDRREKEIEFVKEVANRISLNITYLISGNGKNTNLKYDYIDNPNISKIANVTLFLKFSKEYARKLQPETVLFLEDDVTFTKDFWEILNKVEYPERWHQINIGGHCNQRGIENHYDSESIYSPYLLRSWKLGGFYGALVNGKFLESAGELEMGQKQDKFLFKYILQPPVVIERNISSSIHNRYFPRGIYKQALCENRLFEVTNFPESETQERTENENIIHPQTIDNRFSRGWKQRQKLTNITSQSC